MKIQNLYNKYKPIWAENNSGGGWQHHALTSDVGSVSRVSIVIVTLLLNQQLPQN